MPCGPLRLMYEECVAIDCHQFFTKSNASQSCMALLQLGFYVCIQCKCVTQSIFTALAAPICCFVLSDIKDFVCNKQAQ